MSIESNTLNMTRHHSYKIGDIALGCDINTSHDADDKAKRAAAFLKVGDPAFVRRSDKTWRYAAVCEVSPSTSSSRPFIVFVVTAGGWTKKVEMHHWGKSVRTLEHQAQHPSYDVQTTSPADSRSGAEPKSSSNQAQEDKSSDDGSGVTDNEPSGAPGPQDPPVRQRQRRESFKDWLTRIISVNDGRNEIIHLASDSIDVPDNMKVHEFNDEFTIPVDIEAPQDIDGTDNPPVRPVQRRKSFKDIFTRKASGDGRCKVIDRLTIDDTKVRQFNNKMSSPIDVEGPQDIDGAVIATVVTDAANQNRRKTNSRLNGRNIALTTSSLFKNLMDGAIVLGDDEAPQSTARRRATVADMATDEDGEGLAARSVKPSGNERKSRRTHRRATVDTGKPSPAMAKELRSGGHCAERTRTNVDGNAPSASFVVKNAFARLMEEKGGPSCETFRL